MKQKSKGKLLLLSLAMAVYGVGANSGHAAAADPPWPGMYENDGRTPHTIHMSNSKTGSTLNLVTQYGANTADSAADDAAKIRAAIAAAKAGDEIYLPNGTYNLNSPDPNDTSTHFQLKSGVNIRGESQLGVVLKSNFDNTDKTSSPITSYVMRGKGVNNVYLKNFSITSIWNKTYSSDSTTSNPDAGGPNHGIQILYDSTTSNKSYNVTIDRITIEKFKNNAIKITRAQDVVVQNCTIKNATDVGGGGAGYGIVLEGTYHEDHIGQNDDSARNVAQNNTILGPYIRHGVLLQNYTHNNVIRNNTITNSAIDAIDLHGEDEYLNEVYANTITGVSRGGGVGLGNSGGTTYIHDATGSYNYIHDNVIDSSKYGVWVLFDTPDTTIERNTIRNFYKVSNSSGIYLGKAPRTIIRSNLIDGNGATGFWGIHLAGDSGTGTSTAGNPDYTDIINNKVTGNSGGIKITAGSGVELGGNTVSGNTTNTSYSVAVGSIAPDAIPPSPPSGLQATTVGKTRVTLSWTAGTGANRYLIYAGSTLVGTTEGQTSYEVVNLLTGTNYSFTIMGSDNGGNLSAASNALTVTTLQ
ncbi:UNVERIFIED_CONTAM: parallel beta-helix repeat protein [Paenibacillus sp. PvR008]